MERGGFLCWLFSSSVVVSHLLLGIQDCCRPDSMDLGEEYLWWYGMVHQRGKYVVAVNEARREIGVAAVWRHKIQTSRVCFRRTH